MWPTLAILFIVTLLFAPAAWPAPPHKSAGAKNEPVEVTAPSGKIGDSGYVVPIPEIKMRSIIGNRPPAPPPAVEPEEPPDKEFSTPPPKPEEMIQPPESSEPVPPSPVRATPLPPVEQIPESQVDVTPQVKEPPRLPFEPAARKPQEPASGSGIVEQPTVSQEEGPPFHSPQAPEPVKELPPPKKEILKGRAAGPTVPALLDNPPVKSAAKPVPMESLRLGGSADSGESITLDTRREPEIAPEPPPPAREFVPEPEPAPVHTPETVSKPPKETAPQPEPEPVAPAPVTVPAPDVQPAPPPKEAVPMEPPSEPSEETSAPKETVPVFEQPPPPPKESFPSPLDSEALHSREVRDYLNQAAPILEELSLLMTKAPSLNIADYDPSDPAAPLVPKELFLKMDSMKRELQILDSKTFSIIPPAKYAKFHTVIRESITSTYQACDSILAFLKESSPENFQKAVNSLTKARELIRRTRTAES